MKTFLTPEQQWDRTIALAAFGWRQARTMANLRLAIIVAPHRLFRVGDVVVITFMNGGGERQPVEGFSSKGFAVKGRRKSGRYIQYGRYTNSMDFGSFQQEDKIPAWQFRAREDKESKFVPAGHMRFLEVPGHLQDRLVDDPAVRGYVLEAVRALHAARRVSADSPTPTSKEIHNA